MTSVNGKTLATAVIVFLSGFAFMQTTVNGGEAKKNYHADIRTATNVLIADIEDLQEDIVKHLDGPAERKLYKLSDMTLGKLVAFRKTVDAKADRKELYAQFDRFDKDVHHLLEKLEKVEDVPAVFKLDAKQIEISDTDLHFAIFAGDESTERLNEVLRRQTELFLQTVHDLEDIAEFSLKGTPDSALMAAKLNSLSANIALFKMNLENEAREEELQKLFLPINQAWELVIVQIKLLPPGKNVFLLRTAARVDRIHARLYEHLGFKGKRPALIIQS